MNGPRGLMDKASDFESEDCGFESLRGHFFFLVLFNAEINVGISHIGDANLAGNN